MNKILNVNRLPIEPLLFITDVFDAAAHGVFHHAPVNVFRQTGFAADNHAVGRRHCFNGGTRLRVMG